MESELLLSCGEKRVSYYRIAVLNSGCILGSPKARSENIPIATPHPRPINSESLVAPKHDCFSKASQVISMYNESCGPLLNKSRAGWDCVHLDWSGRRRYYMNCVLKRWMWRCNEGKGFLRKAVPLSAPSYSRRWSVPRGNCINNLRKKHKEIYSRPEDWQGKGLIKQRRRIKCTTIVTAQGKIEKAP